ncbi:hypothetical protein B0H66DRAFT_538951 [Apodospora peruviana]|uniref:Uncharacterized protein n=1 Tax=Apodospora peruviana TaxID=516989 RepID=A0AAE0HU31_9PEZI|nr:hypothetical protein B0H66DRAFT_538951 [Apodospora peruviana]
MSKPKTSWLTLSAGLFLIAQVRAYDLSVALWNSSDCARPSPDTVTQILNIPRDDDNDPVGTITCFPFRNMNFNGWTKDTHSGQTIAFIDTHHIQDGCELVFYNPNLPPNQGQDEINTGRCWQAYRRVHRGSSCPSITFDPLDFAVSYCCGDACYVPRGAKDSKKPVFPPPPPVPLPEKRDTRNLPKAIGGGYHGHNGVSESSSAGKVRAVAVADPRALKSAPIVGGQKKRSPIRDGLIDHSPPEKTPPKASDLGPDCKFVASSPVRITYLPSVQISDAVRCTSGPDFSGGPCSYDFQFSTDIQLMSSSTFGVSEAIMVGMEGIISSTTTFNTDWSKSVTNGQTITTGVVVTLPQGRFGFPTYKQKLHCATGEFKDCNKDEVNNLGDREYCLPVLFANSSRPADQTFEPTGTYLMVDST